MMMVMPLWRSARISAMPCAELGRVEAGEPFVEQQQVGIERERARELEPLLVDVGELRGGERHLVAEPDAVEQRDCGGLGLRAGERVAAAEREADHHVLDHAHGFEHAHQLEGAREAEPRDAVRRRCG